MNETSRNGEHDRKGGARRAAAAAVAVVLLSVLASAWALQLWRADRQVPFQYQGDSWYYAAMVKGIIDNGWYMTNPSLGAPQGMALYDMLNCDNWNYLVLKFLALFSRDPFTVIHLYFLLSFPLAALAAYGFFRGLRVPRPAAVVLSVLYTMLPFHFMRGEIHLFLSIYYTVPWMMLSLFWLLRGELTFFPPDSTGRPRFRLRSAKVWWTVLFCVLTASSVVYFAFFACFFFLVGGICAWLRRRRHAVIGDTALVIALLLVVGLLNLLPTIVFQARHGASAEAVKRNPTEGETFGLKVFQLLAPVDGHRQRALAEFKADYTRRAPLINENSAATLGGVAAGGFLFLCGWLFYGFVRRPDPSPLRDTLGDLSLLSLAGLLLGLVGGFGPLFTYLFPRIRGLNRVSIYLALFALAAVGLLWARWLEQPRGTLRRRAGWALAPLLLIGGVWDQSSLSFIPKYTQLQERTAGDRDFVQRVEAALPRGAAVFQLPVMRFPEESFLAMPAYDHFRPYLYSTHVRWSYGAVKGREGDRWQCAVVQRPLPEFIRELRENGFSGITINRRGNPFFRRPANRPLLPLEIHYDRTGFPGGGKELEERLQSLLGVTPLVSADKELVFFPLTGTR